MSSTHHVLITGGAGFIGSHTAERLLTEGHRVRVLDALTAQVHGPARRSEYLSSEAELIVGDVCDVDVVREALRDVDVVYHFAAETGVGQSMHEVERYYRTNVLGTAVLWQEIARVERRPARVVLASSRAVYGEGAYRCVSCGPVFPTARDPRLLRKSQWLHRCPNCGKPVQSIATTEDAPLSCLSVYAITKKMQEETCAFLAKVLGVPLTILRYFNVYGPRQALDNPYTGIVAGFSSRMLNGSPITLYEEGLPLRDFVHVDDVVQANMLAFRAAEPLLVCNVGSGSVTSIRDLAGALRRIASSSVPVHSTKRFRIGDIFACYADLERSRSVLGYSPRVPLDVGLRQLVLWLAGRTASDKSAAVEEELRRAGILHG